MKGLLSRIWTSSLWWLWLLLLIAALNILASFVHTRADLTKEKRFTLSRSTRELLRDLEDPVIIDVFLKGEFPAGFRRLADRTGEILQEFKESGRSNIRYAFHSPDEIIEGETSYADTLGSMGVVPINLTVQIKAGEQQQYVFPVAWIRYGDRSQVVDLYSGGKRFITPEEMNSAEAMMEYQFINAIHKLTSPSRPLVGYTTGNGQPVGAEVQDLIENTIRPNYELFTLSLSTQPAIPDTFKLIFVVKPTIGFTDEERFKIDQYIMRGGKVIWAIDNLAAEMDSLQYNSRTIAYERNLNLTDLFFRYGARINPDLVMDLQCDFLPFIVGGTQDNPQYEFLKWNYFPLFESRSNHPITRNLRLVSGRFVNSIDTIKAEGIRKTVLLSSSANSRTIGSPAIISLNENRNAPEDESFKQDNIPVAVLLEGKFRSLFANRVSRQKLDSLASQGMPFVDANQEDTKMIIIADGDMLLNEFSPRQGQILPMGVNQFTIGTNYEYQFANRDFVLNSLEYLLGDRNIIETRNKDFVLRVLDPKKVEDQRIQWQFINIGIPIILVLLFGFIYQQVRKRKFA